MQTKTLRILSLHLAVALYGCLLAACSSEQGYRVAFSQCSQGAWREKVNQEMLAAQHLYEQHVRLSIVNSYDDAALQARQIDSLVQTGIDLLVVAPNEDTKAINDALKRVRAKGIPVVFFDRKTSLSDYTAFIGGSNEEAGRAIGVNVVDVARGMTGTGRKPYVLEVTAQMTSSPARERHIGFAKALEGHDELEYEWRESDWSSEATYRILMEQHKAGRLPDIVFCHNDGMATGAYKALVELKAEGRVKLFGIDGMPGEGLDYVQFGHQTASYVYPTGGAEIVRLALDILTGRPYQRENMLQGILVVRENAWSIATTTSELMRQNSDLVTIQHKLENYFGLYNAQRRMLVASLVCILLLIVAVAMSVRAYVQTRRTIRQRQSMNEEQTLFYTDPNRRRMAEIFSKPEEQLPEPKPQDVLFAEQLNEAIRKNMSNPNLKMDELGEELGLRRAQLYRRVKALTGVSPVELLRQMRLQQAYVLLGSTTKTVAEIAYEVGFNTPGYFSKCFKEQYGKLPMDLRDGSTKQP